MFGPANGVSNKSSTGKDLSHVDSSDSSVKIIQPLLLYVLHKTYNLAFSCRSHAVMVKKCTKKRDAHVELLLCLFI